MIRLSRTFRFQNMALEPKQLSSSSDGAFIAISINVLMGFLWGQNGNSFQPTQEEERGYVRNRDYTGMWVRLGSTDLMASKVMFLRSNQGDRLDGNESVADSFRSDLVGFKSWSGRFLVSFSPLTSARKNLQSGVRFPRTPLPSLLFSTDKYHPCNI
ncbi:hypothetical protein TNCV_2802131 [Trichonephila clavipes]|nr:hypothetical protein TNCV_2802131 [Trichonephila clavipes]